MKNRVKKRIKSQNGAVTVFVVVAMLFFVLFILSSYTLISRRHQVQEENLNGFMQVYGNKSPEERYNSYFENGAIFIYTEEQLKKVGTGELVQIQEENGKIFEFKPDATYVLMNDIYLDDTTDEAGNFTPIGTNTPFTGMFDGMGHTIKNMRINLPDTVDVGMFKFVVGGYICNLTLDDNTNIVGRREIGGIAAKIYGGTVIENCTFKGRIESTYTGGDTINGSETNAANIGGIVGFSASSTDQILSCTNESAVIAVKNQAGGICGAIYGTLTLNTNYGIVTTSGNFAGGMCGWLTSTGSISNCYNYNAIKSSQGYVGGLVGSSSGSIEGSYNRGNIEGTNNVGGIVGYTDNDLWSNNNYAIVKGTNNIGGIVGYAESKTDSNIEIYNCNSGNSSSVTGENYIGGVAGFTKKTSIYSCDNYGGFIANTGTAGGIVGAVLNSRISYCYNQKDYISMSGKTCGGICGWLGNASSIERSYNWTDITLTATEDTHLGGIVGHSLNSSSASDDTSVKNIQYCQNGGIINGYDNTAGIIGYAAANTSIVECKNIDKIKGNQNVGGIVGYSYSIQVAKSNNTATITANSDYVGGIVRKVN